MLLLKNLLLRHKVRHYSLITRLYANIFNENQSVLRLDFKLPVCFEVRIKVTMVSEIKSLGRVE